MEEIGFSMDKSKKAEYEDVKGKVMKALKDKFSIIEIKLKKTN